MEGEAAEHDERQAFGDLFAGAQHVAADTGDLAHRQPPNRNDRNHNHGRQRRGAPSNRDSGDHQTE